jgi:phasin family protein
MSVTPEQVVAVGKANLEAGLKSSVAAINTVFGAVERVSALNLQTARASFDDAVAFVKAMAAVKNPKDLLALQLGLLNPSTEKGIAYVRAVSAIGTQAKDDLTQQYEAEVARLVGQVGTALEGCLKNAPAGSEAAVSAMKSAIAQANTAYEGATKAVKEAAAKAQASLDSAAAAAVENLTKSTKAAASALRLVA